MFETETLRIFSSTKLFEAEMSFVSDHENESFNGAGSFAAYPGEL